MAPPSVAADVPAGRDSRAAAPSAHPPSPIEIAAHNDPETILREWQGTCSGKHYLLQALFAELGLSSQIIACTTVVPVDRRP